MKANFRMGKYLSKLGTRVIIGLIAADFLWTLVRYLLIQSVLSDHLSDNFEPIDYIITNSLFVVCILLLTIGLFNIGLYYYKQSKLAIVSFIILIVIIAVKIIIIISQFILIFNKFSVTIIENVVQISELVFGFNYIALFLFYNLFQKELKSKTGIGLGQGVIPYIFGFFALVYPITNILNLADIPFTNYEAIKTLMHILSYIPAILEVLLFFDLMRRFDALKQLQNNYLSEVNA